MMFRVGRLCCGVAVLLSTGCVSLGPRAPLRVGVSPDSPPLAMKQDSAVVGLEADMALLLAHRLGRRLEWVELGSDRLVPALLSGDVDIVMSGLAITPPRERRVDFCNPYLRTGLMVLARRSDASVAASAERMLGSARRVGIMKGSPADRFLRDRYRRLERVTFQSAEEAARAVLEERVDVFVAGGPMVFWLAARYDPELVVASSRLTEEELAWAVRGDQHALKRRANRVLDRWKRDGTLVRLLDRWMRVLR